jgi:hypothetical protein
MKRLIQSGKNIGDLYHFTSLYHLIYIINDDQIKGPVSLTRNQYFNRTERYIATEPECKIRLDGNSLSDTYKIKPYHDQKYFDGNEFEDLKGDKFEPVDYESEERVDRTISPVKMYIKDITIYEEMVDQASINLTSPEDKQDKIDLLRILRKREYNINDIDKQPAITLNEMINYVKKQSGVSVIIV